jgi:hypothetical protein
LSNQRGPSVEEQEGKKRKREFICREFVSSDIVFIAFLGFVWNFLGFCVNVYIIVAKIILRLSLYSGVQYIAERHETM